MLAYLINQEFCFQKYEFHDKSVILIMYIDILIDSHPPSPLVTMITDVKMRDDICYNYIFRV